MVVNSELRTALVSHQAVYFVSLITVT